MMLKVALLLLCITVAVTKKNNGPGVELKPCGCPKHLRLVCANRRTFLNSCLAKCSGFKTFTDGPCKVGDCGSCPTVLQTVCGSDGKTYNNRCLARCNGVSVAHAGKCRTKKAAKGGCGCIALYDPAFYDPVCGKNGKTYSNSCRASCANVAVDYHGTCKPAGRGCFCIALYDPVCGKNGKTYSNSCRASCAGVSVAHAGKCQSKKAAKGGCGCIALYDPALYDPVCGKNGKTYSNSCRASCANVAVDYHGRCKPAGRGCFCIALYDPVCGKNGKTYSNSCRASCARVPVSYRGKCKPVAEPPVNCICPAVFDPVCGSDGKVYSNSCRAACANVEVSGTGSCFNTNM